jgi:hypothetical protein
MASGANDPLQTCVLCYSQQLTRYESRKMNEAQRRAVRLILRLSGFNFMRTLR